VTEEPTLYEAAYILNTELPDEEVEEQVKQLEEVVSEAGGEVVGTRDFRTRRLAYQIDTHTHGIYRLLYFRGSGEVVAALKTDLGVRQGVIRARVFLANPEAIVTDEAADQQEGGEAPEVAPEDEGRADLPAEDESAAGEEAEE
jgi:small subunit ribosomal protein S6